MTTVRHNGQHLITSDTVLESLGIPAGSEVTEAQLWEIIAANVGAFVAAMKSRKRSGLDAPDTSRLERMLIPPPQPSPTI